MIAEDILATFKTTIEMARSEKMNVPDIVEYVSKVVGHNMVIGLAERVDSDTYRISVMAGETGQTLEGIEFSIGEGFLGHVVATNKSAYWPNAFHDPRVHLFKHHGIHVSSVACSPVRRYNEITGVLFALLPTPSEHVLTLVDLLAFLVGRQILIESQKASLDVSTLRFTALFELIQAIHQVEDPKNILYVVLDMAMNLEQGSFACVAFLPDSHADAKLQLISRGMSQSVADDYGKELLRTYIHRPCNEFSDRQLPNVRTLGDTSVLEYPIFFRNRVMAILSVAVDSSHSHEMRELGNALATLGAVALHFMYTNLEQGGIIRDVTLMHKVTGYWMRDSQRQAERLKELVLAFSRWLNWSSIDVHELSAVALLTIYDKEFLFETLPALPDKVKRVIDHYHAIMNGELAGEAPFSVDGQILAVVTRHLSDESTPPGVDSDLNRKFEAFLTQHFPKTQQISPDEKRGLLPLNIETLSTLPSRENLTLRELGVLQLLIQGHTNREIAQSLGISEHTVKNHMTNIFLKLGVTDRTQAIAYVLGNLH